MCTGSTSELCDESATGVEYLDTASIGVGGKDSTGSDVISYAQWRLENEVAWPDSATETADLYRHQTGY